MGVWRQLGTAANSRALSYSQSLEARRSSGESVVSRLVKCGSLEDALQVFHRLPHRTALCWTALISGYIASGNGQEALKMYERMQEEGVKPNTYTFVTLLRACSRVHDIREGRRFHAEAVKFRCESDLYVGTCLMDMYVKCGSSKDVQNVFHNMPERDVVAWTVMLTAYAKQGQAGKALQLYEEMQVEGFSPNDRTFVCAIQACGMLAEKEADILMDGQSTRLRALTMGRAIHADAWRRGYSSDGFVSSTLVSMYGKCGSIVDALNVFDSFVQVDVVSWNAILAASVEQGQSERALQLYERMREEGVSPDARSFVCVIQSCGMIAEIGEDNTIGAHSTKLTSLLKGKVLHADALMKGLESNCFVASALVSMYGKCGSLFNAQNVFDTLSHRDVVSWTIMVVAYVQNGEAEKGLQLYELMREEGMSPDAGTFVSVILACGMEADKEDDVVVDGLSTKAKSLEKGRALHSDAVRKGCHWDVFVGSTLISFYGKCGCLADAANVLYSLPQRNVVSWNAMFAACAELSAEMTLPLYKQMREQGVSPNEITYICILRACSITGGLRVCRQIHQDIVESQYDSCPFLLNSLIHAYGKCASMVEAHKVFDGQQRPTLVSWNALIAGYARQGDYERSLQCYEEMGRAGMTPDEVTFLALISACSYAGLVDKGVQYFKSMSRDYGLTPAIEHYVSLVDLIGRAGHFSIIEDLLSRLPVQPNQALWLCILGACQKYGRVLLGEQAFDAAISLDPKHSAPYVLMANIYADGGHLEFANDVMELRQVEGAWKKPGRSWIECPLEVHAFVAGQQNSPQAYILLGSLRLALQKDSFELVLKCKKHSRSCT